MTDRQDRTRGALANPAVAAALAKKQAEIQARTHDSVVQAAMAAHLVRSAREMRTTYRRQAIPARAYLELAGAILGSFAVLWLLFG